MGLIKITADMTESERTAVINTNMQYLQLSNRLRKYPIGMIVSFATDIDPNELYGGTWERIKGRVIWGIDDGETAGVTGGEKTHTLTESELPKIDGGIATAVVGGHAANGVSGHAYGTNFGTVSETIVGTTGGAGTQYGYGYKFGGNQPHNNMMPYYGAYVWRKTGHEIGEDPTLTEYEAFVQQMNTAISEALAKERLTTNAACANALRGSASGAAVSLTNVSPNEHTLGVKVSSKNLFTPNTTPTVPSNMGLTCTYDSTDNTFTINGTLAANGNINLATLNIPLDDYYIARYYVSGDITVPEGVAYKALFAMFVYGASSQFLERLSQKVDNYNTPIIAAEAKNIYSISSANKWTFYLQNFGIGTVFNNYKFKIAVIKKDIYYADIPYTPNVSDFSTAKVTRCGKNLFDKDMPFTDNNKVTEGAATGYLTYFIQLQPNTKYYAKCFAPVTTDATVTILSSNKAVNSDVSTGIVLSRQLTGWKTELTLTTDDTGRLYVGNNANNLSRIKEIIAACNLQIELGTTATEYEPYKTPTEYTPAADGTVSGVKSLYPTTTLITDTVGTIIEAEYSKDINKAFAELHQAIISLGGNV